MIARFRFMRAIGTVYTHFDNLQFNSRYRLLIVLLPDTTKFEGRSSLTYNMIPPSLESRSNQ